MKRTDEEWREIIIDRLYYWLNRISGIPITPKKTQEIEEIYQQVLEGIHKNTKVI